MTPIFSMVLIIAIVVVVSLTAIILYNVHQQKKAEKLLNSFNEVAAKLNLSIAKRREVGNSMIGYDHANKKILLITLEGSKHGGYLMDLKEDGSYSVHKIYGPVTNKKPNLNSYVEIIAAIKPRERRQPATSALLH